MAKNTEIRSKETKRDIRDTNCPIDLFDYVEDLAIKNERSIPQQLRVIIREHKICQEKHK